MKTKVGLSTCSISSRIITIDLKNLSNMKKVLLAIAVVAMMVLGASCSKEKDCKCTATVGGVTVEVGTYHIEEGSCSDLETTISGYQVVTCKRV